MQPRSEVNDVSPSSLSHIVGQQSVVQQVVTALDASQMDAKKFDHSLLVGPPGMGKSALAAVIAAEMAGGFHEVLGQSIKKSADLNALLLAAKDRDVVHIDEAHELKTPFQTVLYMALDKRKIVLNGQKGQIPDSIPLKDFTLLLSSTDEHALLQPLRDRMKLILRFQFYSNDELVIVQQQRSRALGWDVEEAVFPLIAQRSRGTPRLALRLLQSCRRVCRSIGETTITVDHLQRACELEQIDSLGLGPIEQQYLQIVATGARLNVISSILSLPTKTVSEVVEPFLIRAGLVLKDDQGKRQLTAKGREHVSDCCPDVV